MVGTRPIDRPAEYDDVSRDTHLLKCGGCRPRVRSGGPPVVEDEYARGACEGLWIDVPVPRG